MKINYNVQGKERKAFVNAIAEITEQEATYKGAPTYAYEIGKYTVDRDGALIGRKNDSLAAKLAERGFVAQEMPEETAAETIEENTAEIPAEIAPESESQADGGETAEDEEQGENGAVVGENESVSQTLQALGVGSLSIGFPLDGFSPETLDNLNKMVISKAPLIKKALGVEELPIAQNKDGLTFPWFSVNATADEITAYAQFIAQLCKTAQAKTRVTAVAPESFDNEKFSMRVWMISLGMKGAEYALSRKLLMAKLDGNSGFRYEDKQPRNPRSGERVYKEVVSVRFTAETLGKLAELASQSNMSRNQLIESVVCEYIQAEYPADDEAVETADEGDAVDTTESAPESEVQGDE